MFFLALLLVHLAFGIYFVYRYYRHDINQTLDKAIEEDENSDQIRKYRGIMLIAAYIILIIIWPLLKRESVVED